MTQISTRNRQQKLHAPALRLCQKGGHGTPLQMHKLYLQATLALNRACGVTTATHLVVKETWSVMFVTVLPDHTNSRYISRFCVESHKHTIQQVGFTNSYSCTYCQKTKYKNPITFLDIHDFQFLAEISLSTLSWSLVDWKKWN